MEIYFTPAENRASQKRDAHFSPTSSSWSSPRSAPNYQKCFPFTHPKTVWIEIPESTRRCHFRLSVPHLSRKTPTPSRLSQKTCISKPTEKLREGWLKKTREKREITPRGVKKTKTKWGLAGEVKRREQGCRWRGCLAPTLQHGLMTD